jgi:post-segregation antitoxin (ccd killing protein)
MSVQITEAMVQQYRSTVYHLAQQKGSKLRNAVRVETITGKNAFFDQLGATAARRRTSRHADTPRMDTPHNRRRVSVADYDWADLIDNEDQVRLLMDPASAYAEAAAMAMGRAIDDAILEAHDATAYTGETGSTSTSYSTSMDVAVTVRWPGVSSDDCGLNVAKLIEAGRLLGAQNIDPDEPRWLVVNAAAIASLMMDTRVNSHDYNSLRPLTDGKIVKYYGFNFIPTERVLTHSVATQDKLPFWAGSPSTAGMLLAIGKDISGKISERADKNYATQVFSSMTVGATRMEEARCGRILCDKNGGPEGNLD